MPTYVYKCDKCGHTFERLQRMTDAPLKRCPQCRGRVQRVISGGVGIIFKGSGFYETDYKRAESAPPCGSGRTCCGRDTRCDSPPCE